ncbi:Multi antimicrobial extrusion protein [Phytophthora cactorum]|nr:Multi antimicrobial extrusion protein [Phytophthora cactorum]
MDEKLIPKDSSSPRNSVVAIETLQGDADHHVEPDPEPMEEVRELLKLILPVTGTTVLEFLPGFVSILLAGNMGGPNTQHYVDAATISVMAYGAKRSDKIGIYFQTGVVVLSVALVPMLASTRRHILDRDFSRLMLPGLPFLFLYELVRKVMQSQNIVKPLVAIAVIGNLVNLALVMAWLNIILYTAFYGIAVAASIRVGNCLGADQPKKAKMACFLALTITLGSRWCTALLIDLASKIMAMWSPLEIADGLNAVMQGIFRGAGSRNQPLRNVIGYYGGGIPLGAILAFAADMGVEGLWWGIGFGIAATWLSLTFMMLNYWRWDQLASEARQRTAQ